MNFNPKIIISNFLDDDDDFDIHTCNMYCLVYC